LALELTPSLHKKLPAELTIALLTAFLAGGGTVALFCTVGVHV
jgi:hypothetical protein